MNPVKKAAARVQEFVSDHKVAIAVTTTAVVTTAVMIRVNRGAVRQWNDFLAERGLTNEFYTQLDLDN